MIFRVPQCGDIVIPTFLTRDRTISFHDQYLKVRSQFVKRNNEIICEEQWIPPYKEIVKLPLILQAFTIFLNTINFRENERREFKLINTTEVEGASSASVAPFSTRSIFDPFAQTKTLCNHEQMAFFYRHHSVLLSHTMSIWLLGRILSTMTLFALPQTGFFTKRRH